MADTCEFCLPRGDICKAHSGNPESGQFTCTRPPGHGGDHVACGGAYGHKFHTWPQKELSGERKFHIELVLTGGMKAVCLKALCREDAETKAVMSEIEQIRALGFHDVDVEIMSIGEGQ